MLAIGHSVPIYETNRGINWHTGTYGKYQTKNLKFLVHQQRPTRAYVETLGPMASIILKLKITGTPAEANKVINWDTGTYSRYQTINVIFLVHQRRPTGS